MKQTKQSLIWDYDTEVRLIELYAQNPVLWNPQHPDYQKVARKNEEIQQITYEIDKILLEKEKPLLSMYHNAVEEVKRKWKNLRDSFIREEKKMKTLQGYQSEWKHYSGLLFLREAGKKPSLNVTVDADPVIGSLLMDIHNVKEEFVEKDNHMFNEDLEHAVITDLETSTVNLASEESEEEARSSQYSQNSSKRLKTSDCDERPHLFGRYVASALCQMDEEDMEHAVRGITKVLFKYRPTRQHRGS